MLTDLNRLLDKAPSDAVREALLARVRAVLETPPIAPDQNPVPPR